MDKDQRTVMWIVLVLIAGAVIWNIVEINSKPPRPPGTYQECQGQDGHVSC